VDDRRDIVLKVRTCVTVQMSGRNNKEVDFLHWVWAWRFLGDEHNNKSCTLPQNHTMDPAPAGARPLLADARVTSVADVITGSIVLLPDLRVTSLTFIHVSWK